MLNNSHGGSFSFYMNKISFAWNLVMLSFPCLLYVLAGCSQTFLSCFWLVMASRRICSTILQGIEMGLTSSLDCPSCLFWKWAWALPFSNHHGPPWSPWPLEAIDSTLQWYWAMLSETITCILSSADNYISSLPKLSQSHSPLCGLYPSLQTLLLCTETCKALGAIDIINKKYICAASIFVYTCMLLNIYIAKAIGYAPCRSRNGQPAHLFPSRTSRCLENIDCSG